MNTTLFEKLHADGIVSDASLEKVKQHYNKKPVSVHWELKTLLYLGVLLLSTGLGIIIYKNIDTIGHQTILALIALVTGACFYYCNKHKRPFSLAKVESPNGYFDYVLLLGCLTFLSFIGYLQFRYNVFGNRYGLATFIPMLVLFFCAYYFDHLGILSMAITNLAAWAGLAVTPAKILSENNFNDETIILTGLLLGVLLVVTGVLSARKKVKAHFEFTYVNFGMHLLFIACLAAMFYFENIYLLWMLVLTGISYFFYAQAFSKKSFYYILVLTLYFYIGLSYTVIRLLFYSGTEIGGVYLALLYFIGSAIGLILFLINMNRKIKAL
ncbi:MAG: DUF2157 domain-containing protein [Ferruginibacter sp.]